MAIQLSVLLIAQHSPQLQLTPQVPDLWLNSYYPPPQGSPIQMGRVDQDRRHGTVVQDKVEATSSR